MSRWRSRAHRAHYGQDYQRKRRALLANAPACAMCGRAGADTVDHIVPIALGGTNDWDNLRPAHLRCNSRAGQRVGAARRAGRASSDLGLPPSKGSSFT